MNPRKIYLGIKRGIWPQIFLERNIFWYTGQLILSKIIKIVVTSCQLLILKCNKFDFGWGSAPDPNGGAYSASPDLVAGFKGASSKCGSQDFNPQSKGSSHNSSVDQELATIHQINTKMSKINIYRRRCMSRVRIGGAGGRRNVRPCRMQQRTVQFSDVPAKWWW